MYLAYIKDLTTELSDYLIELDVNNNTEQITGNYCRF